jgi:CheY-like chemotaxis protein
MSNQTQQKNVVFYADDDIDDLDIIKEAFLKFTDSVRLETAVDGIEALSMLERFATEGIKPCLIILDINMPRLNGRETLLKLRSLTHFRDTPVILFTTSSQNSDKQFALKHNAGFITKPINVSQLDVIINTFINHCGKEDRESMLAKKKS